MYAINDFLVVIVLDINLMDPTVDYFPPVSSLYTCTIPYCTGALDHRLHSIFFPNEKLCK